MGGSPCLLLRPTRLLSGTSHHPTLWPMATVTAVFFPGLGSGSRAWVRDPSPCPLVSPLPLPPPQDPLSSLEWELALQLQIAEAARRLCREENLSRQARRQRKHAMLQEEKKLRELERCLGEQRRTSGPPSAAALPLGRGEPAAPRVLPWAMRELMWNDGRWRGSGLLHLPLCPALCLMFQIKL